MFLLLLCLGKFCLGIAYSRDTLLLLSHFFLIEFYAVANVAMYV